MTRRPVFLAAVLALALLLVCASLLVLAAAAWQLGAAASTPALEPRLRTLEAQVQRQEELLLYLATRVNAQPIPQGTPVPTPYVPPGSTPAAEILGAVLIEDGRCCAGATEGQTLDIEASFSASSPFGPITHMRVQAGAALFGGAGLELAPWEPFQATRTFPVYVPINWTGFYVSVQYLDASGRISPIFSDDISIEGMPAPTP